MTSSPRCVSLLRGTRAVGAAAQGGADAAAAAAKVMRKLGKARAANMFAHLRKVAQHPLLVRQLHSDKQVAAIAKLAYGRFVLRFQLHITNDRTYVLHPLLVRQLFSDRHIAAIAKLAYGRSSASISHSPGVHFSCISCT